MRYLVALLLISGFLSLNSQNTYSKVFDLEETAFRNYMINFNMLNDTLIMYTGHFCNAGTVYRECTYMSKVSMEGNILHKKKLDSLVVINGGKNNIAHRDGIIYHTSVSVHDDYQHTFLRFFDHNFNLLDIKSFVGVHPSTNIDNRGLAIFDSYLYIFGSARNKESKNDTIQIIKTDLQGNEIWRNNYVDKDLKMTVHNLQKTPDGHLAFFITHEAGAGHSNNFRGYQIMKIDTSGQLLNSFDFEDFNNISRKVVVDKVGDYYFNSLDHPIDQDEEWWENSGRINKLNKDMESLEWTLILPHNQLIDFRRYRINDIIEAQNGDIVACGTVFDNSDTETEGIADKHAAWNGFIIRVTSEGEIVWLRIFKNENDLNSKDIGGRFRPSHLNKIIEMPDGRLMAAGMVTFNTLQIKDIDQHETEAFHIWLLMVDENGCLEDYPCEEIIRLESPKSPPKLVRSDNSWIFVGRKPLRQTFSGKDTLIDGKSYLELLYSEDPEGDTFKGTKEYFREEDNKVYGYGLSELRGDVETLIYDFNLKHGDTIRIGYSPLMQVISDSTEFITLFNGERRQVFRFSCDGIDYSWPMWIEGMGSVLGLSRSMFTCYFDLFETLSCFYQNDTLIYQNPNFEKCWMTTSTLDYKSGRISFYPNPTKDIVNFSLSEGLSYPLRYEVVQIATGQRVEYGVFEAHHDTQLEVGYLPSGIYILRLIDPNGKIAIGKMAVE